MNFSPIQLFRRLIIVIVVVDALTGAL
jgi:hypothetical protein